MLKVLIGNMFESKAKTLVNTVNCVGVMGKGVALEFKNRYPDMYKEYVLLCNKGLVKPGEPYLYTNLLGDSIINFPTKEDWRSVSNIQYVICGLKWFRDNYEDMKIQSVAFPPLGCGNGGLLWEDVGPIMYRALNDLPIDIEIYAPFGTKQEQLSKEFLSDYKSIKNRIGLRAKKFNPAWICILEIINRLNNNPCASYIGRTSYQKICYLATIEGINTGFEFKQWSYGPYSADAKEAFVQMSNANLIHEVRRGSMDSIVINDSFDNYREKNIDTIQKYETQIEKIVDIFYRIKNTAQAEMYTTIVYSYNVLKNQSSIVSEKDILDYVLKWKRHWADRANEISDTIRSIAFLNYLDLNYSKELIDIEF